MNRSRWCTRTKSVWNKRSELVESFKRSRSCPSEALAFKEDGMPVFGIERALEHAKSGRVCVRHAERCVAGALVPCFEDNAVLLHLVVLAASEA